MQHKGPLSEFAIASLTLGILAFVPLGLGNLGCAILAVVFGILSLKKIAHPQSDARGEGLAAAGIVMGILCIIMMIISAIVIMKNPAYLEQLEQIFKRPLAH